MFCWGAEVFLKGLSRRVGFEVGGGEGFETFAFAA